LVWDEANLEETSRERGTRMKIEEAETPYAWPGDYSIEASDSDVSDNDGEGDDDDDIGGEVHLGASTKEAHDRAVAIQQQRNEDLAALSERLAAVKRKQEAGGDVATHPEHTEGEKDDFKRRRKLHYDEGRAWRDQKKPQQSQIVHKH